MNKILKRKKKESIGQNLNGKGKFKRVGEMNPEKSLVHGQDWLD